MTNILRSQVGVFRPKEGHHMLTVFFTQASFIASGGNSNRHPSLDDFIGRLCQEIQCPIHWTANISFA